MINSGTQMQPINLNRSLIEHNIILGIKHEVTVPASLHQEVCNHRAEHAEFLIHGKYGLPSMYLTNYPIHMPLLAAFQESCQYVKNNKISDLIILVKSDG